jgi:hypothetical protein
MSARRPGKLADVAGREHDVFWPHFRAFPLAAMLRAQVQLGMECMAWVKGQRGFEQPDVG